MSDLAASSSSESLHGLNCPQCGGMVPVPEGQVIVICPYCELRSFVQGDRGILRYQVPARVERDKAAQALDKFLKSTWAIAPAAARQAQLNEVFLMYLPFWSVWGRVAGWVFGEKKVGSGDHKRYEPREARVVEEMGWNSAACDVGEFGVQRVDIADENLQPFNPEALHASGMVFEPVGSFVEAQKTAQTEFEDAVRKKAGLDRVGQIFVRTLRKRFGLVYHPLWVLRYLFRGRAFQVVVDGYSSKVLYGKAPGNTLYRAAILVFGMAIGALVAIDGPALVLSASDDGDILVGGLLLFVVGLGIIYGAYRTFRHGEQYEFRQGGSGLFSAVNTKSVIEMATQSKELKQWIDLLD